jgi:hypothetical protein
MLDGKEKMSFCVFCEKEPAKMTVTQNGYLMGEKCDRRSLRLGVNWNENTTLETLKAKLGK